MEFQNAIGKRAFTALTKYIYDSGDTIASWCDKHGIRKGVVYGWASRNSPNVKYIAMMCDLGLDINYILTGKARKGDAD